MSETDPGADLPSSPEQTYFQSVESVFIQLRGAPLLLSPSDWQIAEVWYGQGIPLGLVRRALEEYFAARHDRGVKRKVSSLRMCRNAVERAWEEVRGLRSSSTPKGGVLTAPMDVAARLCSLSEHLPRSWSGRETTVQKLLLLRGSPDVVETELIALDEEMLEIATAALTAAERESLADEVLGALTDVASRLPPTELAKASHRLLLLKVRHKLGLPVLSLFSPEAQEEDAP